MEVCGTKKNVQLTFTSKRQIKMLGSYLASKVVSK